MNDFSFYWHDYETWGADPRRDRAAQFAGQRTDADLNPIGEPLVLYARPSDDMLPQPDACLVTGITPQQALERGVPEADFFRRIHREMARPGSCVVGYNNLRFDDEVTRFGFYRNFIDVYGREWQGGNSRWDLIDVLRLAHALRPEGIEWPRDDNGVVSFRLDRLSRANGLTHEDAHDALGDVRVTIAMARLLKQRQPRLYDYCFTHRGKQAAAKLLDLRNRTPLLHVSARYPAARGCIAPVAPVGRLPGNRNGVVVFDLRADPAMLVELSPEALRQRLFTPSAELPEGSERVPLKTVHLNKCPVLAPLNTLTPEAAERWAIDPARVEAHAARLAALGDLQPRLDELFAPDEGQTFPDDPDLSLYGGFFSNHDKQQIEAIGRLSADALVDYHPVFDDAKLHELLFRYRARNWPDTLKADECQRWEEYRQWRLRDPAGGASIVAETYHARLAELENEHPDDAAVRELLAALRTWGGRVLGERLSPRAIALKSHCPDKA